MKILKLEQLIQKKYSEPDYGIFSSLKRHSAGEMSTDEDKKNLQHLIKNMRNLQG